MLALVVASLAGVSARPPPARADEFDEREQQLKALHVDDDLRPRIHRAIGVGSHWLAGVVGAEGAPTPTAKPKARVQAGIGAGPAILATLALAHARTSESVAAAKRSVQRLLVDDKSAAVEILSQTYEAGIAGLLAADPACEVPAGVARELALRIAGGQDVGSGWWGYALSRVGATAAARGVPAEPIGTVNLSTTQFAVLGAFGLRRAGAPVPFDVWERHLRGLCRYQTSDGSWSYGPSRAPNGYANGTYMGIAGLLVAEDALRGRIQEEVLVERVAAAKARGMKALRREAANFVQYAKTAATKTQGKFARVGGVIGVDGYGMYALEKACIFAGLERVEGGSWYEAGARLLVAAQRDDGSWGDVITTSFALLFLARSPERYRPTTVTEADVPARPTTSGDPMRPTTPPDPVPVPPVPPTPPQPPAPPAAGPTGR